MDLLRKIQSVCEKTQTRVEIMLQVNTSDEDSKSGMHSFEEVRKLVMASLDVADWISLVGLMTIGAPDRPGFVELEALKKRLEREVVGCPPLRLSMGMSNDFVAAIAAGSNEVRVGTAILGERPTSKDTV
eukprot:Protomagalhaensia_sp_Gyna_25__685@NODE_131_length_4993_cov_97_972951_g103_i0_p6_GENE_NODE_131_length_4993_cov_97_972951_g103_i0NODE_131_length_4993_cov_97_972951_g103_i0_p6_ORF_typecomplete_len130_score23_64Ala_racemase_N/PF01168_20/9_8e27_NODE_131_length_4993_cov_97_972951_g103_i028053194